MSRWFEQTALRRRLAQWRTAGVLASEHAAAAHAVLGLPAAPPWRGFLDRLSLWLGAALLGAGVVFFVAANWDELGKFVRFAGLEALLVAAVGAALWLRRRPVAAQAALFFGTLALGALLAQLGQTYQTGADTWQLFALWAALALPFVVAARSGPLWLVWIAIADVALCLWLGLHLSRAFRALDAVNVVGIVNAALLIVWEFLARYVPELRGRIGPRLLAAAALAALTFGAAAGILDRDTRGVELLPWLFATGLSLRVYSVDRRDVVILAMTVLGAIVVVTTTLARTLFEGKTDPALALLLIAAVVVGSSFAAVVWLRRLAHEADA